MATRRTRQKAPPTSEKIIEAEEKVDIKTTSTSEKPVSNEPSATQPDEETSHQPDAKPNLKRKELTNDFLRSQAKKPRLQKPVSTSQVIAAAENNLKDSVCEGLILISIGLNPGIMTGKTGHAYAHPSNRYWPTLYASGITPIQHAPSETHSLQSLYGLGHTNIIPDLATVGGSTLTKEHYLAGAAVLDAKIHKLRPQAVMIVGKGIWEEWFRYKRGRKMGKNDNFHYGWQDKALWVGRKKDVWEGARTFVVTTTSGLSTAHTAEERVEIWRPMGEWFAPRREEWMKEKGKEKEKEEEEEEEGQQKD